MSDYIFSDGREITFDLTKVSYGQYLGLFSKNESDERSDETLARAAGLELDELKALSLVDYKKLLRAFIERCQSPLSDPND